MSERKRTHNGRDLDGNYRVKQEDVADIETDPDGPDRLRDDVRLGGAVADVGPQAGEYGTHIAELVEENRTDVKRVTGRDREGADS